MLFELIILVADSDPPTFEVMRLLLELILFGTEILLTTKFDIVVVARLVVPVAFRLPVTTEPLNIVFAESAVTLVVANCAVPVAVILPVTKAPKFATLAKRLSNIPVTPFIRLVTISEKVLVEEVATKGPDIVVVPESNILRNSDIVVVVETPFIVEVSKLPVLVEKVSDWVVVPDPPGIVTVIVPEAFVVAVTPDPTKLSITAFEVSAVPSSCTPRTATKQFTSVGPQGSVNSKPGSIVAPTVKGLVRGAAKTVLVEVNTNAKIIKNLNLKFILLLYTCFNYTT
jgi:hypothetical protein